MALPEKSTARCPFVSQNGALTAEEGSAYQTGTEKGLGKACSSDLRRRILVALAFRTLAFLAFDRLLDDALLHDRRGRIGRSGRGHRPTGLDSSRRSACDDRSTRGWLLIAHQRSALVADVGRHGVEGAARRAWLRAHLAHLLFLAEPVFEGEEGGLLAPPFLELGFAQAAAQLSRGFLLEPGDHFVILEAHLLLVIGHLQLTRRELDAALRALLHLHRDPGLAVRALRHVPFELDAALRARRRVLRDEGAALAALDHLAEAVDLPVDRDAGRDGDRRAEDDEEEPPWDAEDRDRAAEERQGLLHRDRLGAGPDDAGRGRDDDVVGAVRQTGGHGQGADEESVGLGDGRVRRHDGRALTQLDREGHARDSVVRALIPDVSGDAEGGARLERLARARRHHRDVSLGRQDVERDRRGVVRLLRGSAFVDPVVGVDPDEDLLVAGEGDAADIERDVQESAERAA